MRRAGVVGVDEAAVRAGFGLRHAGLVGGGRGSRRERRIRGVAGRQGGVVGRRTGRGTELQAAPIVVDRSGRGSNGSDGSRDAADGDGGLQVDGRARRGDLQGLRALRDIRSILQGIKVEEVGSRGAGGGQTEEGREGQTAHLRRHDDDLASAVRGRDEERV